MQSESFQKELVPQAASLPEELQFLSVNNVCRIVGLGRTLINEEIRSGRLKSAKVGKRRLISIAAVRLWLAIYLAE
jgi:excisionase family DNA binding protein